MKIDKGKIDNDSSAGPCTSASAVSSLRAYLKKDWLRCLLLAGVGFIVRAPALQGQLIWDDQYLARDNPFIKSPLLALEAFRHHLFLDSFSAHYRPVQNLSLMVDYAIWNTNTFGFHLTNVLLHVAGGVLLYFLLRRLFASLGLLTLGKIDNSLVAFAAALIWTVHPVHSAAVDYISGRADSLAFVFACGSWLLFLKARELKSRRFEIVLYICAAASALLALCSRESACIWFPLFILFVLLFGRSFSRRTKCLIVIACVAILAIYGGLRQLPGQRANSGPSMGWSGPVRAVLMLRALGDYGRLMVFPSNLHMERTVFNPGAFQNEKARQDLIELEYLSIAGLIVIALMSLLAFRRGQAQRLRIFGAAWFVLAFLPISNLVDLNATVAEHWLYLPSVGFLMFLAGCAIELPLRSRHITVVFASIAVVALCVRSFNRSSDWVDPETFIPGRRQPAAQVAASVSISGKIYANRGDYEKAEKIFRNILKIQPDYTIARNNLADTLAHQGKSQEAEKLLVEATHGAEQSRKDYPRTWVAALSLAHTLHGRQDETGAFAVLEKARKDYPDTWELIGCESELFRLADKLDDAIALIRPFAQKNWWHYGAWMAMGQVLAEKGDVDLAESALRQASWLDVRSTDALNLIALMRLRQNRFDEAWRAHNAAPFLANRISRGSVLLSNILDKMGRADEARAALAEVTRLRHQAGAEKVAN